MPSAATSDRHQGRGAATRRCPLEGHQRKLYVVGGVLQGWPGRCLALALPRSLCPAPPSSIIRPPRHVCLFAPGRRCATSPRPRRPSLRRAVEDHAHRRNHESQVSRHHQNSPVCVTSNARVPAIHARATCCVRPLPTVAPSPGLALRGAIEQKEADHKKQQAEADQEIDNTKAKIQVTSWIVDLGSHSSLKFYPVVILLTTETTATRLYSSVSRRPGRFAPRRCPRSRQ